MSQTYLEDTFELFQRMRSLLGNSANLDRNVALACFALETILDLVYRISQAQSNPEASSCGRFSGDSEIPSKGVPEMLATFNVPMWLVLACQVHVDSNLVLSEDVGLVRNCLASTTD